LTAYEERGKHVFGRTWVGPSVPIRSNTAQTCEYPFSVIFHTKLNDSACFLLAEITGSVLFSNGLNAAAHTSNNK
jgi:hypothetical protein